MTNRRPCNGVLAGMKGTVLALVSVLAVVACSGAPGRPVAAAVTTTPVRVQPVAVVHRSGGPIPWIDTVAPPYVPPKPLPRKPLSRKAPACTAADVAVASTGSSGRSQDRGTVLVFTNTSHKPCLLLGWPTVTVSGPGLATTVIKQHMSLGTSFDMPPGQTTQLWLSAQDDCLIDAGNLHVPIVDRLTVALAKHTSVTLTGLSLPRACGGIGENVYSRQTPEAQDPPVPLAGAKFFLETPPAPAHAGQRYVYVLVVRNPTKKPITMLPCPAYDEWLSIGTNTGHDLLLNCGNRRSLSPGAVLRFAMHVTIPTDTPTGTAVLHWGLRDGYYPEFGLRAIQVVGNDNPCHAGQLTALAPDAAVPFAGSGLYDAKDSGTSISVTLTNTSSTLCTLQGAPTVALTAANHRGLGLRWGDVGFGQHLPSPAQVRLPPGGSARTVLAWHAKWCGHDPNPVTVTLGLPARAGLVRLTPAQGWTPPACKGWNFPDQVSSTQFG